MGQAVDIVGTVFKEDSIILLARVQGKDAAAIVQADIDSALYTVSLLDPDDPDLAAVVEGHKEIDVPIPGLIFNSLQKDDLWSVDSTGYNFKHVLDVSENQAFGIAGRVYRAEFRLTPGSGQVIVVRFRLECI